MKDAYLTTRQNLIGVTIPEESRTYKPFSHEKVINLTLEGITKAGFTLDTEGYTTAKGGNVAVGRYTIKNVADSEMQLQIAWLNSYDKSKRLTWGIGGQVRICLNGMISADMAAFKKKHQGDIQDYSPRAIEEYIKRAPYAFSLLQKQRDKMKQVKIDKTITAHILGEMFMTEDILTSTQLNIIKKEADMPSFDYQSENSLWELYNHTTLSLKDLHPSLYMESHMKAHEFFVVKSGQVPVVNNLNVIEMDPNQIKLF